MVAYVQLPLAFKPNLHFSCVCTSAAVCFFYCCKASQPNLFACLAFMSLSLITSLKLQGLFGFFSIISFIYPCHRQIISHVLSLLFTIFIFTFHPVQVICPFFLRYTVPLFFSVLLVSFHSSHSPPVLVFTILCIRPQNIDFQFHNQLAIRYFSVSPSHTWLSPFLPPGKAQSRSTSKGCGATC